MQWVSKDCRSNHKEYEMIYRKAKDIDEALLMMQESPKYVLFSGGSDMSLKLFQSSYDGMIDISSLEELKQIKEDDSSINIGALTTISTLLESPLIEKYLPHLHAVCKTFASHQIRNIATLGGNIVNDSPVADLIAPLLVVDAKVTLRSIEGERTLLLEELFDGFKSLKMKNEIMTSFTMSPRKESWYYRKVGARERLNITKLSLVMLKSEDKFYLSGASLSPYVKRFRNLEKLFNSACFHDVDIQKAMRKDISLSDGSRSTKEYRKRVFFNMIKEALEQLV